MPPRPTRTLNPLPFQELEPHRFEDMVRQLAYDYRDWKSLEAIGRSGADGGTDIRGVERDDVQPAETLDESEDSDVPGGAAAGADRVWVFQCKREQKMGPQAVATAVAESLDEGPLPHGFVLATSADLSAKARTRFRTEMVSRGVQEFAVWARGELEDKLFQASNDRLLFAYFGISLQPRRRSLSTQIRSALSLRKQLRRLFPDDNHGAGRYLLLRDPEDDRYPKEAEPPAPRARWVACEYGHLRQPGCLAVIYERHLARVSRDRLQWDAIFEHNQVDDMVDAALRAENAWRERPRSSDPSRTFWEEYVPESERAFLEVIRFVPLDRVLAIDPEGDGYFPIPQVFVRFDAETGPFDEFETPSLRRHARYGGDYPIDLDEAKQVPYFPDPIPEALYPVPDTFAWKRPRIPGRSMGDALEAALRTAADNPGAARSESARGGEREQQTERTDTEFRKWRDSVVAPVFAAVVDRLKPTAFDARVSVCEARSAEPWEHTEEAIELRIHGAPRPHGYRPSVYLRYSRLHADHEIDVTTGPPGPRSPSREGGSRITTSALPETVETHVASALASLSSEK